MRNTLTIAEAAEGLREKKLSVAELVSDCLAAARGRNRELNAYLEIFDDAETEARRLDDMLAAYRKSSSEKLPPLFGIPFAVKDNILIEGKRATAGSKILENYVASYDATVITKLKNQGAVFIGKTNMDEFAMGASCENSAFGPTKNPHDTSRVPGGSSGGSAAAVAAHMALGALGTDTGGSVRQPAALCGVTGFKPSYGSVSRHGMMPMASSLNQIGTLAKNVADTRTIFHAIRGADAFDATLVAPREQNRPPLENLDGITIGVPKEYFMKGLDPRVESIIRSSIRKIESAGARIEEISLPHSEYALPTYYIIVPSEVSSDLARFDGIRYGHSAANTHSLLETYTHSRAEGFGPEVRRRLMLGTYALSAGYYDAYYLKAQKVRRLVYNDFITAFKKVDCILGPTTPTPAFKIGEKSDDPLAMYLADIYTVAVNLTGLPGISINAGTVEEDGVRLPVGLQLIGKLFEDDALLETAEHIEKILVASR